MPKKVSCRARFPPVPPSNPPPPPKRPPPPRPTHLPSIVWFLPVTSTYEVSLPRTFSHLPKPPPQPPRPAAHKAKPDTTQPKNSHCPKPPPVHPKPPPPQPPVRPPPQFPYFTFAPRPPPKIPSDPSERHFPRGLTPYPRPRPRPPPQ